MTARAARWQTDFAVRTESPRGAAGTTELRAFRFLRGCAPCFSLEMLMRGCYLMRRGFMSLSIMHAAEDLEESAARFEEFPASLRSVLMQWLWLQAETRCARALSPVAGAESARRKGPWEWSGQALFK